ncbi:hypothetical protein F4604DRAFT_1688423 [Suillus subluteus]|nr:hypothetical protein F4604DRAFT_1688423 [Suillus subluteus]
MGIENITLFDGDMLLASDWLEGYTRHTDFLPAAEQLKNFKTKLPGTALQWARSPVDQWVLALTTKQTATWSKFDAAFVSRWALLTQLTPSSAHRFPFKPAPAHTLCNTSTNPKHIVPPSPAPMHPTESNGSSQAPVLTHSPVSILSLSLPSPDQAPAAPPPLSKLPPPTPIPLCQQPVASTNAQSMPANAGMARTNVDNTSKKEREGCREKEGLGEEGYEEQEKVEVRWLCEEVSNLIPGLAIELPGTLPPTASTTSPASNLTPTTMSPLLTCQTPSTPTPPTPKPPPVVPTQPQPPASSAHAQHTPANAGVARTNADGTQQQEQRMKEEEKAPPPAHNSLHAMSPAPTSTLQPSSMVAAAPTPSAVPPPSRTPPVDPIPAPRTNAQLTPANAGMARMNADGTREQEERRRVRREEKRNGGRRGTRGGTKERKRPGRRGRG